jgi:hypothetical protein
MLAAAELFASSPTEAVEQAERVVTEAVAAMHRVLVEGAVNLGNWRQAGPEQLSEAMRAYQAYLDRVLAL